MERSGYDARRPEAAPMVAIKELAGMVRAIILTDEMRRLPMTDA
jgi:hypothetical protein